MPEVYTLIDSRGTPMALSLPNVRLRDVDGLGMPDLRHLSEQYAQQDGETYLDTRLSKRIVIFSYQLVYNNESDLWDARDDLLEIMKVFASGFTLQIVTPNGNTRLITLRYDSALSLPRSLEMAHEMQVVALQCVAHDPLLYSPNEVAVDFSAGLYAGTWLFGTATGLIFPATFGASVINTPTLVTNLGSWLAYPRLLIGGPLSGPIIENLTTSEKLDLSSYTLVAGEAVVVDLRFGYKTITSSINGNILRYLSTDSDLATFHLAADPEALNGDNTIIAHGSGATVAAQFILAYTPRWIGV